MALLFDPNALGGIPEHDQIRLLEKANWLWENRTFVRHMPLSHNLAGFFKRRVGDYRIVYSYDGDADELTVHLVGTRDDIYDLAAKRLGG